MSGGIFHAAAFSSICDSVDRGQTLSRGRGSVCRATDEIEGGLCYRIEGGARCAGAGMDGKGVEGGGRHPRERGRILAGGDLAAVAGQANSGFEGAFDFGQSGGKSGADLLVERRFGKRGADKEASARRPFARQIYRERGAIDTAQRLAQREVGGERLLHAVARDPAVAIEQGAVEGGLVAEGRVQARPVHPGGGGEVVEGGCGIAGLPERGHRAGESEVGVVAAGAAAARRGFLYHPV